MITLRRVTDPVAVRCPYCAAPILTFGEHEGQLAGNGDWLDGGDSIPRFRESLTPAQRAPNGFHAILEVGHAACCTRDYFVAEAIMVNRDLDPNADTDFVGAYFFFNGDRGRPTNFLASRGKREWIMQRFDSPLGPVLHHYFGPFQMLDEPPLSPDGMVSTDHGRRNWDYARGILLALWDDLQALCASTA